MPTIKLGAFNGEQPRLISRLLPATGAQFSVNTRLNDGGITPFNSAVQVTEIASAASKTIHKFRNQWLSWPGNVHAAQGPVADERLYYTGDGKPKLRIAKTVYDLAVARPTAAVTATLGGTGTGDVQTRIYRSQTGRTVLLETNPSLAATLAERFIFLDNSAIFSEGNACEVLFNPQLVERLGLPAVTQTIVSFLGAEQTLTSPTTLPLAPAEFGTFIESHSASQKDAFGRLTFLISHAGFLKREIIRRPAKAPAVQKTRKTQPDKAPA